jgi:hypothetical protein
MVRNGYRADGAPRGHDRRADAAAAGASPEMPLPEAAAVVTAFGEQRIEITYTASGESDLHLANDGVDVTGRNLGKLEGQKTFNVSQKRSFGTMHQPSLLLCRRSSRGTPWCIEQGRA